MVMVSCYGSLKGRSITSIRYSYSSHKGKQLVNKRNNVVHSALLGGAERVRYPWYKETIQETAVTKPAGMNLPDALYR